MATRHLDTLGARLRHARKQRGLKQVPLAVAAKLGQSDVSKIERGGEEPKPGKAGDFDPLQTGSEQVLKDLTEQARAEAQAASTPAR